VASCCAATYLCSLYLLLIWTDDNKPPGSGGVTWPSRRLPRGMLVGPTYQVSPVVGPTHLRWTNRRVPRGSSWLSWPNREPPCGTGIVTGIFNLHSFLSPNCTQIVLHSQSCTQCTPWFNPDPWLICSIFSEFILIALLIQKSWNFHQKSQNSWWSPL
jgi:hypothetical protein